MFEIYQERLSKKMYRSSRNIRTTRIKLLSRLTTFTLIGMVGVVFLTIFLFAWYSKDLPRPDKVRRVEGLSTVILDRKGQVLYDIYGDANRVPIPFSQMPLALRQATLSIEDKDFYKHQGFSLTGFGRAMINIFIFHRLEGGSTLTQQLVKTVLLSNERTLPRKIKEFILAIQIERKYSKDEILQMYLNEAPYGGPTSGVETASQYYFNKHAKDLTRLEAAVLAGFPQSPSAYSPFSGDSKAYLWRSQQVLRRMREDGYLTKEEEAQANKDLPKLKFSTEPANFKAAHFVMYVKDLLIKQFGQNLVESGGLRVTTALDWEIQKNAEKIVKEEISKLKTLKVSNGAVVILDPKTGEILGMVGSKDYSATDSGGLKFNVATQGLRQPGSAIKPIVYAAAFKKGYTPATVLMDTETHFPGGASQKDYVPKNYDGKFHGPMQLRYALGNSINVVAVKTLALVGVKEALETAYEMGLITLKPDWQTMSRVGLSLTLGGAEVHLLDLTSSFGVFATGGIRHEPIAILKVENSSGKTIFENRPDSGKRVLSEQVSFLVSSILADNGARKDVFGENSWLVINGKTVAVKTGTTDDKRDNWTIGYSQKSSAYTPQYVVGVWVGNNDNSPMDPGLASGITGAAPIWNKVMDFVLKDKPDQPLNPPAKIVTSQVDSSYGGLPYQGKPARNEFFVEGTEPTTVSPIYQRLKISKNNNDRLANPQEIAKGEYEEKDYLVFKENDPVSTDGKNRWQEGIDAWVNQQGDSQYHPPTQLSEQGANDVVAHFKTPGDQSRIDSNDVPVKVEAISSNDIIKLEIFVDGSSYKTTSSNKFSETIRLEKGTHELKAKATDSKGNSGEERVRIGVEVPWDYATPTPTPTPSPTPTPTPTP